MAISTKSNGVVDPDQLSPAFIDLETEIREKLYFTQHAALRHITYRVEGSTVTLYGRVPSYYLKQLAQVKVTCVAGIDCVDNRIEVAVT